MVANELTDVEIIQSKANTKRSFRLTGSQAAGTGVVKAVPGLNNRIFITDVIFNSTGATANAFLTDGTTKYMNDVDLVLGDAKHFKFETHLTTGENKKVDITVGAGTVEWTVLGYTTN